MGLTVTTVNFGGCSRCDQPYDRCTCRTDMTTGSGVAAVYQMTCGSQRNVKGLTVYCDKLPGHQGYHEVVIDGVSLRW